MIEPRVLVTGATGMVGSAIVRALLKRKRTVRMMTRNSERARALFGASVSIAVGDLRAPASLRQACHGIREIYHAAAELGFRGGKALRHFLSPAGFCVSTAEFVGPDAGGARAEWTEGRLRAAPLSRQLVRQRGRENRYWFILPVRLPLWAILHRQSPLTLPD